MLLAADTSGWRSLCRLISRANLAGTKGIAGVEKELKAALQEWMILNRDFAPLPVPPPAKKKK